MLGDLERLASEREGEIERALSEAKRAKSDAEALQVLLSAMEEIREEVANSAVKNVSVENFDEVQASLRNELAKISKPIISAIKSLNLNKTRLQEIQEKLEKKNAIVFNDSDDIQIIRKPKTNMTIDNLSDILFPESLKVTNFDDLKSYFDQMCEVMRTCMVVNVPAPQVTVNSPDVHVPKIEIPEIVIPEITVQAPEMDLDLSPLLEAIKSLKDVIRRTSANTLTKMQAMSGPNAVTVRKGQIRVNNTSNESIPVVSGLSLPKFDYVSNSISPATTETYTFKTGGASGTTVATVTIVYTDSTRVDISTVTKV